MIFSARGKKKLATIVNVLLLGALWANDTLMVDMIHLPYAIKTIASDSTGTIWLAGGKGLEKFEAGQFIQQDPYFYEWLIAQDGKVINVKEYRWEEGQYGFYPWKKFEGWLKFLPPGRQYATAAQDKLGRIWVASDCNIYIFRIEDRFDKIHQGHSSRGIFEHEGQLYVNTYEGIFRGDSLLFDYPDFGEGYIEKIDEELYFSWSGLLRYHPKSGKKTNIYKEACQGRNNWIVLLARKIQDTIWVGTSTGLGRVQNDSIILVSDSMVVEDIQYKEGRFLLATSSHGIWEKQGGKLINLELPVYHYKQILFHKGLYFFPSDQGLITWDGEDYETWNINNGLSHNDIASCLFDSHGYLWVSTLSGLNRIDLEKRAVSNYLGNVEFNKRSFLKKQDTLYFGGVNGIYRFAPGDFLQDDIASIQSNAPYPKVFISLALLIIFLLSLALYWNHHKYKKGKQGKALQLKEKEKELLLIQLEHYILQSDIPISVHNLASHLGISDRSLYRIFKEYGLTPGHFIREQKLKKAKHLVATKKVRCVKSLAQTIGYTETYLVKIFKEQFNEDLTDSLR